MLNVIGGGERVGRAGDMVRLNRRGPWPSRAKRLDERYAMIVGVECLLDTFESNKGEPIYRYKLTTGETLDSRKGGRTLTIDSDSGKRYSGALLAMLIA